jgi:protein O-GlcNAc transferase
MNHATFLAAQAHFVEGRFEKAFEITQREVTRPKPTPDALYLHAGVLMRLGRWDQAEFFAKRAIDARPGVSAYFGVLGEIQCRAGKRSDSVRALEHAVKLDPGHRNATMLLGQLAEWADDATAAERWYRRAIELGPEQSDATNSLALLLTNTLRASEAGDVLAPVLAKTGCPVEVLTAAAAISNYAPTDDAPQAVAEQRLELHRRLGEAIQTRVGPVPTPANLSPSGSSPLKLGYVSPDFREHSCSRYLEALLKHHDRGRFQVCCYSTWSAGDATTARLRGHLSKSDRFAEVSHLSQDALAERIRSEKIDILIDCAGLTSEHRLETFARRPAPVQVTYLGYPNTTGLAAFDARLVDEITDPPGAERWAVEPLERIEGCFLGFTPPAGIETIASTVVGGGAASRRFVSFNTSAKLNEPLARVWAAILRACPGWNLMLKARAFTDQAVRARVEALFASQGVERDRLELSGAKATSLDHLRMYTNADIALDTFPYNGTTTTCEALVMGVPVVTLMGDHHAARVGASVLRAAGLRELVTATVDEYIGLATALAHDETRRASLRLGLRERVLASSLCDGVGFARRFEAALLRVHARVVASGR